MVGGFKQTEETLLVGNLLILKCDKYMQINQILEYFQSNIHLSGIFLLKSILEIYLYTYFTSRDSCYGGCKGKY